MEGKWEKWFAWHPVWVDQHGLVWFKEIERKIKELPGIHGPGCICFYRLKDKYSG